MLLADLPHRCILGGGSSLVSNPMVPVELDAQLDDRVLQLSGPSPPNLLGLTEFKNSVFWSFQKFRGSRCSGVL